MTTLTPRGKGKSRGEITDTVDRSGQDMDDKLGDLDKISADVLKLRETVAALEFGGTDEGNDMVEDSFEEAEAVTVDVFDNEDDQLDSIQAENKDHQEEIQELSDSDESDLSKVSDASSQIETDQTACSMIPIKEQLLRDIDFIVGEVGRARDSREESENTQQDYRGQVHSGGGRRR